MAKQKCGTCRFFQEAGLAGSGWCHHPQRKVSSDVMIMVRRNELACRDEWSQSLWAPAESIPGDGDPVFQRPRNHGPLPPAEVDDLRALAKISERELPTSTGEDVLLSEARIIAEPHERMPLSPSAQSFDVRSAVFRAREAYRERNRARDAAVRKSESAIPIPTSMDMLADADREPKAFDRSPRSAPRQDHSDPVLEVGDSPGTDAEHAEDRHHRAGKSPERSPELGTQENRAMAIEPYDPSADSLSWFLNSSPQDGETAPEAPAEPNLQLETLHQLAAEPLPAWFRTDMPRMCRTCRDFRPMADGRRGRCANAWAFTHSRLVNEDDAAPCDSAFGDWWAAVDDVWLVAADVANHGRPTPLLDRMIALKDPAKKRSRGSS